MIIRDSKKPAVTRKRLDALEAEVPVPLPPEYAGVLLKERNEAARSVAGSPMPLRQATIQHGFAVAFPPLFPFPLR